MHCHPELIKSLQLPLQLDAEPLYVSVAIITPRDLPRKVGSGMHVVMCLELVALTSSELSCLPMPTSFPVVGTNGIVSAVLRLVDILFFTLTLLKFLLSPVLTRVSGDGVSSVTVRGGSQALCLSFLLSALSYGLKPLFSPEVSASNTPFSLLDADPSGRIMGSKGCS